VDGNDVFEGRVGDVKVLRDSRDEVEIWISGGRIGVRLKWNGRCLKVVGFPDVEEGCVSVLETKGCVKLGSCLVAVNGVSLEGASESESLQIIASEMSDETTLIFRKPVDAFPSDNNDVDDGMGFLGVEQRQFETKLRAEFWNRLINVNTKRIWTLDCGYKELSKVRFFSVQIKNTSTRQAIRFYLGRRRFNAIEIRKMKFGGKYEASIWVLDDSASESKNKFGFSKKSLGTFGTEERALREAERKVKERNDGKTGIQPTPSMELCASEAVCLGIGHLVTHLEIEVGLEIVPALSFREIQMYLFRELLCCPTLRKVLLVNIPEKLKKVSYVGHCVQDSDVFKFLPLEVIFIPRFQVKKVIPKPMRTRSFRALVEDSRQEVDATKGSSSVFGHFFKGLSKSAQELAVKEAAEREAEVRKDNKRSLDDNSVGEKALLKRNREIKLTASKLQRIFRRNRVSRLYFTHYRTLRVVTNIQRFARGWLGRKRARDWKRIANRAAERIQKTWRMILGAREYEFTRHERSKAARRVQPVVRGMFGRKLFRWHKHHTGAAISLQKAIRGYLAVQTLKRLKAAHFSSQVLIPAICLLQSVFRGMLGRRVASALREKKYFRDVVVPSAIMIQKIARASIGRRVANEARSRLHSAVAIQKMERGRVARLRYVDLVHEKKRSDAATKIATIVRMCIARELAEWRRRERRFFFLEQPAAKRIQAVWNGLQTRRMFKVFVRQDSAVLVLQRAWCMILAKRKARESLNQLANAYKAKLVIRMQAAFRGVLGRRKFLMLQLEVNSRRIWATRTIQRKWRTWIALAEKARTNIALAREIHHIEMELIDLDLADLEDDIEEIWKERMKLQRSLKTTERFRSKLKDGRREILERIPDLEAELNALDPADESHIPWREVFDEEILVATNIVEMAHQDLSSQKLRLAEIEKAIFELELEVEELEVERFRLEQKRVLQIEDHRRRELKACIKAFDRHREKLIRRQRIRWKPHDDRRKVVHRFLEEQSESKREPNMPFARVSNMSASVESRFQERDDQLAQKVHTEDSLQHRAAFLTAGNNAMPVVETFDSAIAQTKKLIQLYTFDMRRPVQDQRSDPSKFCSLCGMPRLLCVCQSHLQKPFKKTKGDEGFYFLASSRKIYC